MSCYVCLMVVVHTANYRTVKVPKTMNFYKKWHSNNASYVRVQGGMLFTLAASVVQIYIFLNPKSVSRVPGKFLIALLKQEARYLW